MNKLSSTILATALVSAISFTAFASVSSAKGPQRGGPQAQNSGPIHFACAENAAERIETGLDRMAERLELDATQTSAFDAFKSAGIAAQASFSETCVAFKPAERGQDNSDTDLVDRLNNRQAMMSAQLSAMSDVLPEFEAFYDTLTDEQKEQMRPNRRGQHRHGPGSNNGSHNHGQNGTQNSDAPANG